MAPAPSADVKRFQQLQEAARHARRPREIDWWLNLAFVYDEQYTEWAAEIDNVRVIPRRQGEEYTPRPIANKMAHYAEQQHAFVMQQQPIPDVSPANNDIISQSDAQVALGYAQWAASDGVTNFPRILDRAVWWAVTAGTSFLKWTWDKEQKRPAIEYCTPFDLYLDPYAEEWSQVRWAIHSRFMDAEAIYDRYGIEDLKANPERADPTRHALLLQMGQVPAVEGYSVNEIWMKPNRRRPKGLFAAWCGSQTLVPPMDMPYEALRDQRKLPFTPLGVVPGVNSPYYHSHMKRLRPQQMELNKYHAQQIMQGDNFANLKWFIEAGLKLQQDPSNAPAQVLKAEEGEPGQAPQIIAPPYLPNTNAGEWIVSEMEDTIGIHKVSQGQVQGRLESAKSLETLMEGDKVRLNVLLNTTSWAIAEGFWQIIALAKQYEQPEKLVTIYSADNIAQVREFRARDTDLGIGFKVSMGTGLGFSRAGRTENLFNMWDRGLLQDDPARMLALLDLAGSLPLSSDARDVQLARSENFEMEDGTAVKPNGWDNHVIHIREHNDFRKSQAFRLLSPRAQAVFEFHVKTHEQLLLRELEKQAQQQLVAQGATLGAPEQPPPGEADPNASQEAAAGDGQAGAPPPGKPQQEAPDGGPVPEPAT